MKTCSSPGSLFSNPLSVPTANVPAMEQLTDTETAVLDFERLLTQLHDELEEHSLGSVPIPQDMEEALAARAGLSKGRKMRSEQDAAIEENQDA